MSNVPKFASFKPRKASAADQPESTTTHREDSDERRRPQHRSQQYRKNENGESIKDAYNHHRAHTQRIPEQDRDSPKTAGLQEVESEENRDPYSIFSIDTRGDRGNAQFSTNDSAKVPKYRTPNDRRALGRTSKELGQTNEPRPLSSLSRGAFANLHRQGRYCNPQKAYATDDGAGLASPDLDLDFLPLRRSRKRKRSWEILGAQSFTGLPERSADPVEDGRDETSETSDSSSDSDVGPTADTKDPHLQVRQEHDRMLQKTRDEPQNVLAWLELVGFQDRWVQEGLASDGSKAMNTDNMASAELKMSILSEALGLVSKESTDRERLLLKSMSVGRRIWSPNEQAERWDKMMKQNQNYPILSLCYINFIQSNNFSFEDCRDRLTEYLNNTISDTAVGVDSQMNVERDEQGIHLFLRLITLLRDAGYQEQAIALWQAILQIQFDRGSFLENLDSPHTPSKMIDDFIDFWDTERPRIGEMERSRHPSDPTNDSKNARCTGVAVDEPKNCLAAWAFAEITATSHFPMPGRTSDDDQGEDAFHVVLSGDIKPFLPFCVRPHDPDLVIDAFLAFFQLPPLLGAQSLHAWHTDPFIKTPALPYLSQSYNIKSRSPKTSRCTQALNSLKISPPTPSILITDPTLFQTLLHTQPPQIHTFIHTTLAHFVRALPTHDNIAIYHLALTTHIFPTTARKSAKALLKQRSSHIPLWNAYALVEEQLGNSAAADRTLASAIQMNGSWTLRGKENVLLLWRTYIALALRRGDFALAAGRIVLLSNTTDQSPTANPQTNPPSQVTPEAIATADLTLRRHLTTILSSTSASPSLYRTAALLTELLIYTAYLSPCFSSSSSTSPSTPNQNQNQEPNLTTHPSLTLALETHIHLLPLLSQTQTQPLLELTTHTTNLINHHISSHRPHSHTPTTTFLARARTAHKGYTLFDLVLASLPAVRITPSPLHLQPEPRTPGSWATRITAEIERWESAAGAGVPWGARRVFERATSSGVHGEGDGEDEDADADADADKDAGSRCPALWAARVLFEMEVGEHRRAGEVWRVGCGVLGWWRGWVLLGCLLSTKTEGGDTVVEREEVRRVHADAVERGVRFYVDMQAFATRSEAK